MNQSAEKLINFKRNFEPLYEVKRIICEISNFDGTQIVVSKMDDSLPRRRYQITFDRVLRFGMLFKNAITGSRRHH